MTKKGFTLVELIVVITIIAILWTISFVSFQWYSKSASDSKTVADISNTHKKIALFKVESWFVPKPDNSIHVYAGPANIITFQGEVWKSVKWILDIWYKLENTSEQNYKYSTNGTQRLHTLIGYLEAPYSGILPSTFADSSQKYLYFKGDDIVTLFDENNEYVSDDILDIKKDKISAYLGRKQKQQNIDTDSGNNIIENIPTEIIKNTSPVIEIPTDPTTPAPSYSSCNAGTLTGTNGNYPYSNIAHNANTSSIIDVNISNWSQKYTADISCTDWTATIVSESANAITCNTHYELSWNVCSKIAYNSCKDINARYPSLWNGNYTINPTGSKEIAVTCDMANGWWTKYLDIKATYSMDDAKSCFDGDIINNNQLECINPWKSGIIWTQVKNILHENANITSADAVTGKVYTFNINASTNPVWTDGDSSRTCYWNQGYFTAMYGAGTRVYSKENITRVRFWKNFCRDNLPASRYPGGIAGKEFMNYASINSPEAGPMPWNRESAPKKMSFWIK